MPRNPDFTYKEALNSFNGAPPNGVSGGLTLFRIIRELGIAQDLDENQIAKDVATRLQLSRDEVLEKLVKCRPVKPSLYAVPSYNSAKSAAE